MQSLFNNIRRAFASVAFLLCASVQAQQIEVSTSLGSSVLVAGQRQTIPLRVNLRGFEITNDRERASVNVAIVLDRSGSMGGDKLARAKDAAIMAIERLRSDDIVSLITYDDVIEVIVPATKVSDRAQIIRAIQNVQARGSTALFGGVSQGGAEVQKFFDRNRVNRIILISDGLANVGPSSPDELGSLGASFGRQGISVSTIGLGLGYNEDLMTRLAGRSDGNHFFVQSSSDIVNAFQREFGDILTAVARDVDITITCADGFRPVRVLGREAQIHGQSVVVPLNQIYAGQDKYVVLEVEAPIGRAGESVEAAKVEVRYNNLRTKRDDRLHRAMQVAYTDSREAAGRSVDRPTMESYYTQLTVESNASAITLRDANKKSEAQELLLNNARVLREKAKEYNIPSLNTPANDYEEQAKDMDKKSWGVQRKGLSEYNYHKQRNVK